MQKIDKQDKCDMCNNKEYEYYVEYYHKGTDNSLKLCLECFGKIYRRYPMFFIHKNYL